MEVHDNGDAVDGECAAVFWDCGRSRNSRAHARAEVVVEHGVKNAPRALRSADVSIRALSEAASKGEPMRRGVRGRLYAGALTHRSLP